MSASEAIKIVFDENYFGDSIIDDSRFQELRTVFELKYQKI